MHLVWFSPVFGNHPTPDHVHHLMFFSCKNILQVFSCFGRYFCLHFEAFLLGMAPVYMAFLRFMGEDSEAKNFGYSLEVGGNGRKLIWQGVPRSIRDSHRKVRDSYDGLIIHRNMALFFSGANRQELKLRVTGRIWKEQWFELVVQAFVVQPIATIGPWLADRSCMSTLYAFLTLHGVP